MSKRFWHYKEFSASADGIGALGREMLIKQEVLPFLQERGLAPHECTISWLVDPDYFNQGFGGKARPKLVCIVLYVSSSELL